MRLAIGLAALCLSLVGCGDDDSEPHRVADCTDDALVADGVTYGRDPEQDCKFVDADGHLLEPQP